MLNKVVDLQTAVAIALASIPALLTVLWSIWQHNKRVDDARALLRAEIKSSSNEVLVSVEAAKQKIDVVSVRLNNVEEDMKRALNRIESLHTHTTETTRSLSEHNVKLDTLFKEENEQKQLNSELKKEVAAIQKEVSQFNNSIGSAMEPFEQRLDDIEKKYVKALNEFMERVIKKYGD